jgi:hypothetical protein
MEVKTMTTVKDFFEMHRDGNTATIETDKYGQPLLWIEAHDRGLTVVDCNSSVRELGYRDDSDCDVDEIRNEWLDVLKPIFSD